MCERVASSGSVERLHLPTQEQRIKPSLDAQRSHAIAHGHPVQLFLVARPSDQALGLKPCPWFHGRSPAPVLNSDRSTTWIRDCNKRHHPPHHRFTQTTPLATNVWLSWSLVMVLSPWRLCLQASACTVSRPHASQGRARKGFFGIPIGAWAAVQKTTPPWCVGDTGSPCKCKVRRPEHRWTSPRPPSI